MSDVVWEKKTGSAPESQSSLFMDAYKEWAAGVGYVEARARQATVLTYGAVVGGIKDAPKEIVNHPLETAGKVAIAGATGVVWGAALAVESPLIAQGAFLAGTVAYAGSLWNSYTRLANNLKLRHAVDAVYKSGEPSIMQNSLRVASDVIGPEAFNYAIVMAGVRGGVGPKSLPTFCDNYFGNKLIPRFPIPEAKDLPFGPVEMRFRNYSSLHMHGENGIFRIGEDEWKLNVIDRQIELGIRSSLFGRHVLSSKIGTSPLRVDMNPRTGLISIQEGNHLLEFKHSDLWDKTLPRFPRSCTECQPLREALDKARHQSAKR